MGPAIGLRAVSSARQRVVGIKRPLDLPRYLCEIAHIHLKYLWDLHPLSYPSRPWSPPNAILPPLIFPLQPNLQHYMLKR